MSGASLNDELDREELELDPKRVDDAYAKEERERAESPRWLQWLKSEPGPGDVDSYRQHPLNWDGSYEVAQVLRGLTGLLGNLRLAVVDLLMGGFRILSRRPPAPPDGGAPGGMAGA